MEQRKYDTLKVVIENTAEEMGKSAALAIATEIRKVAEKKDTIRMMFAAAPSQNTTLTALKEIDGLPWERIEAFHMDEYIGITEDKPQSFRNYLRKWIFDEKPFKAVHLIKGDAEDPEKECEEYGKLLTSSTLDIIVLGIGENGHIAFNDPPRALFDDPKPTDIIKLSERSRIQQVNDGCFSNLEDVPHEAITVTIPVFRSAPALFCVVPNSRKADAVRKTLEEPVSEMCPASILRKHEGATLFLDRESASGLH
ncbi:MAG: glucosamine-6-phosphate deaminase [Bullifex sp.]